MCVSLVIARTVATEVALFPGTQQFVLHFCRNLWLSGNMRPRMNAVKGRTNQQNVLMHDEGTLDRAVPVVHG